MRTMLILVLLCSLTQIATQGPTEIVPEGCGTTFSCYAPSNCQLAESSNTLGQSRVFLVDTSNKMLDDCAALIKFYSYAEHWVSVEIESFKDATDITSIDFVHKKDDKSLKTRFTCTANAGELKATLTVKPSSGTHPQKTYDYGPWEIPTKIKCKFDAKVGRVYKIFEYTVNDIVQILINGVGTDEDTVSPPLGKLNCNPSQWKYHLDVTENTKVYKEVKYAPGKYYCEEDSVYKTEYRENGKEYYEDVQLSCFRSLFKVKNALTTIDITAKEYMDIRCAADAKYFCDYDIVVTAGNTGPIRKKPVRIAGSLSASELKCPANSPHIFVNGKPVKGGKFECLSYGVETSWTIGGIMLGSAGPAVYCDKTTPCFYTITDKSVRKGSVGEDRLPKCSRAKDGTLYVNKKKVVPGSLRCDDTTGDYKFTVEGEDEQIVNDDTRFECDYPKAGPTRAEKQNKENKRTLRVGSIIGASIAAGLVAVVVVVMLVCAHMKYRKRKMKADAMNKAAFLKYGTKTASTKGPQVDESESGINWNKLSMSYRYICRDVLLAGVAAPKQAIEKSQEDVGEYARKPVLKAAKKIVKKDEWPATKENTEHKEETDKDFKNSKENYAKIKKRESEERAAYEKKKDEGAAKEKEIEKKS